MPSCGRCNQLVFDGADHNCVVIGSISFNSLRWKHSGQIDAFISYKEYSTYPHHPDRETDVDIDEDSAKLMIEFLQNYLSQMTGDGDG